MLTTKIKKYTKKRKTKIKRNKLPHEKLFEKNLDNTIIKRQTLNLKSLEKSINIKLP